jgi:hypothetical protein
MRTCIEPSARIDPPIPRTSILATRLSLDPSGHLDPAIPACLSRDVRLSVQPSPRVPVGHAGIDRAMSAYPSREVRASLLATRVSLDPSARIAPRHARVSRSKCACLSMAVQKTDIVATLQSRIDSRKTVQSARAAWQTAVQADRTLKDKTNPFVATLSDARREGRRGRQGQGHPRCASHHGPEPEGCCRTLGSRADGVARGGVRPSSSPDVGRSDNGSRGRDRFPIGRGHVTPRLRPACFSRAGMPTKLARIQCVGWNRSK